MSIKRREVRQLQLITTWGVGAIIPLPGNESLMIAGLDKWYYPPDRKKFLIYDPRLCERLGITELRKPPEYHEDSDHEIPSVRFPRWHYCPICGTMHKTGFFSDQPKCPQYKWSTGKSCTNQKYPRKMVPERFIVICLDGHIDDFPIMEWVHRESNYSNDCTIRRSTGSSTYSLSGVTYTCSCGASRSMQGATRIENLRSVYTCKGVKPWLGVDEESGESCDRDCQMVQVGSSNVWFGDVISSIYIPADDPEKENIDNILDSKWERIERHLNNVQVNDDYDWQFIDFIAEDYDVDKYKLKSACLKRLKGLNSDTQSSKRKSEEEYRYFEYENLRKNSGKDNSQFYSKYFPASIYDDSIRSYFSGISLVSKLKEVRALVGFSRLQPDSQKTLNEKKKMLWKGEAGNWLPAVEVFGEGLFFEFNKDTLVQWSKRDDVKNRAEKLDDAYHNNYCHDKSESFGTLSPIYLMIHTFAHLLINELSYVCGYGSSSIRERLYCCKELNEGEKDMYGVMIYTASGDLDGSLGGLVNQGKQGNIEEIIKQAIDKARWCSSDPVCIQSNGQGPGNCNLAGCYNCALLPETCCENANKLLDRGLVIGTLDNPKLGFFEKLI